MMSEHLCKIDIGDIDLTDQRYQISFSNENIVFLGQSIRETGLIHPPMVRPLNDQYIIVSGFNRIKASIHNKKDTISVYTMEPDAGEYQCLLKSITALSFKRQLSQAELIRSIKLLNKFMDEKQIADKAAAIFNMELNVIFIKDLLNIANLPEPALELIHKGNISFKTAKRMQFFQQETIKSFLKIFSKIKASNNKQLEIIQYIVEISKRDAVNIEVFFQNHEIQKIILNEKSEPLLKTKLLREYLYKLRFPTIFKIRQKVQRKINNLKLGNNIKFVPPENFESQNYSISFNAKNYIEFKANVKTLNNVLEKQKLKEVFDQ